MAITSRAAQPTDLAQVLEISTYYVLNTVINFAYQAPSIDTVVSTYNATRERQLPYIVAVEKAEEGGPDDKVIGYTYASPFPSTRLAYAHTLELSIFVHYDYRRKGVGTILMSSILDELKKTQHRAFEPGHDEKSTVYRTVSPEKLISKMSYDVNGPEHETSERLRLWYIEKWGFEEVGRMKNVGYKFDR